MGKTTLIFCVLALVAMTSAFPPQGGANPWLPPWLATAPWMPQWVPCTTVGASCSDCTTRVICTKIGGLAKPCTDPLLPHCNLGVCSATLSAECGGAADGGNPEVVVAEAIQAAAEEVVAVELQKLNN